MMHVQRPAAGRSLFFMEGALTQSGRARGESEERKTGEVYKTSGRSGPLDGHKYTNTRRVKNPRLEQWRPQTNGPPSAYKETVKKCFHTAVVHRLIHYTSVDIASCVFKARSLFYKHK